MITNITNTHKNKEVKKENKKKVKIKVKTIQDYLNSLYNFQDYSNKELNENTLYILKLIQDNPYKVKLNSINYSKKKNELLRKIKINKIHKSNTAILRDKIKLNIIKVKEQTYNLLLLFIESMKNFDNPKDISNNLDLIKYEPKYDIYKEMLSLEKENHIVKEALKDLPILKKNEDRFKILKELLKNNMKTFFIEEESLLSKFSIDDIINKLNANFYKINYIVKPYGFDIGRLIIFVTTMFLFFLIAIIINKIILPLLRIIVVKYIVKNEEDNTEYFDIFDSLKKPIIFLMMLIGMELSLEIFIHPEHISQDVKKIILFLYIFITTIIINKLIDVSFFLYNPYDISKKYRIELVNLVIRIIKLFVYLIGFFYFLHKIGMDTTKIWASLGISSMAIAFAAKDIIANFFSGLKLIIDDVFSNGDWIKLKSGEEGTIIDIGFINTRIRTFSNGLESIPNSKIVNDSFINWNRRKVGRKIEFQIGITYDSKKEDIKKALEDLKELFLNHKKISNPNTNFSKKSFKNGKILSKSDEIGLKNTLFINLTDFNDSAIIINIYAFSKTVNWGEWRELKEELMFDIMEIIKNNNLNFAFPTQTIHIKND